MKEYAKSRMIKTAIEWIKQGRSVATATVIATWGSSPRPVGSQLVVDDEGAFEGSVSGGCIEAAVITEALEVLETGQPRRLHFGVANEQAWELGLACGGEISVFVENVTNHMQILEKTDRLCQSGRAGCLITDMESGQKHLVPMDSRERIEELSEPLQECVNSLIRREQSSLAQSGERLVFIHCLLPPPRMIIIGAVHTAGPLATLGRMTAFDVTIVDPREAFATEERFADVNLNTQWPDEALERMNIHQRTAVVTLTHDPKLDDPALEAALRSDAFYIGALGSSKTHASRLERLEAAGFSKERLERIHGPVGLSIGAVTPEEIAISIMAQIIEKMRKAPLLN